MFKKYILLLTITVSILTCYMSFAKEPLTNQLKAATGTISITAPAELASVMRKMLFELCSTNNNLIGKVEQKNYANALTDLQQGKSDIVLVDRHPTYLAKTFNKWIITPFAATAVVIVTNRDNKISSLKSTALPRIFSGAAQRWKEFSGTKGGFHLIGLYATTSGGQLFRNLVMNKEPVSRNFFPVSTGSQVDIIVAVDKDAIGFRMYDTTKKDAKIKLVAINTITPDKTTISNGKYPLSINYYLCYNKKTKNPLVKIFIKYFKTPEFADKLTAADFIPARNKKENIKK